MLSQALTAHKRSNYWGESVVIDLRIDGIYGKGLAQARPNKIAGSITSHDL